MQAPITTRKWSEIKGLAAVATHAGAKAGSVEDFYFDPQNNTIYALKIKTGLFGHRALLSSAIKGLGQDAVTFASENDLLKENEDAQLAKLFLGKDLLNYRVLSEGGTVVGTVGNVLLDVTVPTQPIIAGYELATGLLSNLSGRFPTFSAQNVKRYGSDVIVVPDAVALELTR